MQNLNEKILLLKSKKKGVIIIMVLTIKIRRKNMNFSNLRVEDIFVSMVLLMDWFHSGSIAHQKHLQIYKKWEMPENSQNQIKIDSIPIRRCLTVNLSCISKKMDSLPLQIISLFLMLQIPMIHMILISNQVS